MDRTQLNQRKAGDEMIQRYEPHGAANDGDFVLYADHLREIAAKDAEINRLLKARSQANDEVCQVLGKALAYPWYKDDQKNFPGATEANGVCVGEQTAESIADEAADEIARLNRELAAIRAKVAFLDDNEETSTLEFVEQVVACSLERLAEIERLRTDRRAAGTDLAAANAALAEMHRRYAEATFLLGECWKAMNKPSWADGDTFDAVASDLSEFLAIDKLEDEIAKGDEQ